MHFFIVVVCFVAFADHAIAQVQVIFRPINNTGSGCLPGSVITTTEQNDQNSTDLVHTLDRFAPRIGIDVPTSEGRLNCTTYTNVSFSKPNQRLYVGMDVGRLRGYLEVDSGTQVDFHVAWDWVGETNHGTNNAYLRGPIYGRFDRRIYNNIKDGDLMGPCGGGILRIVYGIKAVRVGPEVIGTIPDPPQEKQWLIGTSFRPYDCDST